MISKDQSHKCRTTGEQVPWHLIHSITLLSWKRVVALKIWGISKHFKSRQTPQKTVDRNEGDLTKLALEATSASHCPLVVWNKSVSAQHARLETGFF